MLDMVGIPNCYFSRAVAHIHAKEDINQVAQV